MTCSNCKNQKTRKSCGNCCALNTKQFYKDNVHHCICNGTDHSRFTHCFGIFFCRKDCSQITRGRIDYTADFGCLDVVFGTWSDTSMQQKNLSHIKYGPIYALSVSDQVPKTTSRHPKSEMSPDRTLWNPRYTLLLQRSATPAKRAAVSY